MHYEKQLSAIPDNEEDRLKKIQQYEIIDTPPETDFDTIALLAAEIFEAPYASIIFIDREHVFFKANLNTLETSCAGIFAAGDVRAGAMNRVASAVGEGSMAISFVHKYLAEV